MITILTAFRDKLIWFWRYGFVLSLFSLAFIIISPEATRHFEDVWEYITYTTTPYHFDFLTWERDALFAKAQQRFDQSHAHWDDARNSAFVRDYMTDLAYVQQVESQIRQIYLDPNTTDPFAATHDLRQDRDSHRAALQGRQDTVELILEGQVTTILLEQGFGMYGHLLPPMSMRFTRMPNLFVTSPRDTIRLQNSIVIDPLAIDAQVALETRVMADYDVSALVVPLGGIALYPAMIAESSNLSHIIQTFAHEWLHHYLYFHPLGLSYFTGDALAGEARIINETTADLFGREIGALVIERYYPELPLPMLPDDTPPVPPDPQAFDFADAMHTTRSHVDDLLADGAVTAAETYMTQRQHIFYDNGYHLRRINQAFFAFYGGYQAGGGIAGAGGADPIGTTVVHIRQLSASPYEFIQHVQTITTRQQLLTLANSLQNNR